MSVLLGLKPEKVFQFFEEICEIYRKFAPFDTDSVCSPT